MDKLKNYYLFTNMKLKTLLILLFSASFFFAGCRKYPVLSKGYPDRSADLDVLPGFRNPPPGYGEIPYWWWSGDTLNTERLISQLRELHKKKISGVQVNYSHHDSPGWLTDQNGPEIFSEEWWKVYSKISEECSRLNMGIGLSTYTLDWPRGASNLFYNLFYRKPWLNAFELETGEKLRIKGGEKIGKKIPADVFAVRAYPLIQDKLIKGGIDLTEKVKDDSILWSAPEGDWEVWMYRSVRKEGTLNPLMKGSGDTVITGFFRPFEKRAPQQSSKGLNYFFNDELNIGTGKFAWNPDFAAEFQKRKGYDLFEVLPAMWEDIGDITPKVRMDYADVRMSLMEERYFRPIYGWHEKRGMIFGCDSESRGLNPAEFGDYFRATRWYSAPGHDTPGGKADMIKGKVSSSIADLYQRPRVWLEGYHSLGWGATPEQLMYATRENFLYGCTLLNLHGLYYTTYGSYWEWAPPCYHFRMPYWKDMDTFLGYFERLSYLLSQGHLVCDVAILYPVAPYEAEMDGDKSKNTAFDLARKLMASGINFEFIDNESLDRAVVEDGKLKVKDAGAEFRALVFPDMSAIRWKSIKKAADFKKGGGFVFSVGDIPVASDRAGRGDSELNMMNDIAFTHECRLSSVEKTVDAIRSSFIQDVRVTGRSVRALHRKAGFRDVYMVMDARQGDTVEFRTKGAAELWDPWTGNASPLRVVKETATGTQVELPLEEYEAGIVVFTPGKKHVNPPEKKYHPVKEIMLPDEWQVNFIPTMDNTWGDFRLPVTEDNRLIGLEARRFAWAKESKDLSEIAMEPSVTDSLWNRKLYGFGTQFYILGPVPEVSDNEIIEKNLAVMKHPDPSVPVIIEGRSYTWQPYDFSWQLGKEGDPGHQGYHGLKRTVTDDFLCLGKPVEALNETRYEDEIAGGRYYLWSSLTTDRALEADILYSKAPPADKSHSSAVLTPSAVYINGEAVDDTGKGVELAAGTNNILVKYNHGGRGYLVFRRKDVPLPEGRKPLSMRWSDDNGIIPFDASGGNNAAEWFRFITAPGTCTIHVKAFGETNAWIDGKPMKKKNNGLFTAVTVPGKPALVALRILPEKPGISGGCLIPEPVRIETDGSGQMPLGDWSKIGILNNYSGGVCYRTKVNLNEAEVKNKIIIDLGRIAGTAEVSVNDRPAGVKVAPPWRLDLTGFLKEGENRIAVTVYNTLANHYQTIPSRYRGDPVSGLLDPVKIILESEED